MATQNIQITEGGWQDLITLGNLSLSDGDYHTITFLSNGENQVCLSASEPEETLKGHPVQNSVNFGFTYHTGDKIWVKLSNLRPNTAKVVFS